MYAGHRLHFPRQNIYEIPMLVANNTLVFPCMIFFWIAFAAAAAQALEIKARRQIIRDSRKSRQKSWKNMGCFEKDREKHGIIITDEPG